MKTTELTVHTGRRRGIFDITDECRRFVTAALVDADPSARSGLLNVFVPHATCGLVVMELGSGSEEDFLATLDRLLPRDDRYTHRHGATGHGADHLVPAFLPPTITIPIVDGRLALGTWQSIALVDTNVDNPVRQLRLAIES